MKGRTGKKSSLLIVTMLAAASLAGCGGGSGDAANPNTVAFTSALMSDGVFYLRGSSGSYAAGKMTTSGLPTLNGASYSYTAPDWAPSDPLGYFLNNTGVWQAYIATSSFVDNGDGSYTADGIYNFSIDSVTDLAGQSPTCIDFFGNTTPCIPGHTYATGAKQYSASATLLMDYYSLFYQLAAYTDLNGDPMTALPTTGSASYCIQIIAGSQADLYTPAAGSTYDLRHPTDCTPAHIASPGGVIKTGITITSGGRNGMTVALINFPAAGAAAAYSYVVGEYGGNYWHGSYIPAAGGTPGLNTYYNRTAFDTLTAAHGLPVLP
ncbi:MAG: hypothetical protein KKH12_03610 [Gammaproteobacteria bacterium]|nr:hypothetical protein [Gammaproteobacteria bacterium]MBU1480742.1 hypothetical protein [Gammaproteobacteria bacterium]